MIINYFYRISNPDRGDKLLRILAHIINVDFKSMVNARYVVYVIIHNK